MSTPSIPHDARVSQLKASDPAGSVWVAANAGSGKTYVLVRRVVRHLLEGTPPGAILCLTFTKAAAATMANRVFGLLSEWVQKDDAALSLELEAIEGKKPSPARLKTARRLFAEALETPGGLKIQTIHAFCERVLHLFPFEANVPSQFTILDERASTELMMQARTEILVAAAADPSGPLGRALDHLSILGADSTITELIDEALKERAHLLAMMQVDGQQLALDLRAILGVLEGETLESLEEEEITATHLPVSEWRSIAAEIRHLSQSANDLKTAEKLEISALDPRLHLGLYRSIFLTTDDDKKADKSILTQKVSKPRPDLMAQFLQEAERLHALVQRRRALHLYQGTLATLVIAQAVMARVEQAKNRRGALDFDDLITRTHALIKGSAQWVLYKLDQSIDHILVDEAQDTSPAQWEIIKVLVEEFTSGQSARGSRNRTIFVVGDEKQSIYSFQGADPRYFDEMRSHFARRFKTSGGAFERVPLKHSFRSTAEILTVVDRVFSEDNARRGLSADDVTPVHEAARAGAPGIVEIWPPSRGEKKTLPTSWELPVDAPLPGNAENRLSQRIANHIRLWLDRGETLPARDTPIRPGDILILVRSRGRLFNAIIRALKRANIPVAGADRLVLNDHIAVQDLLALGDVLITPQDDYALAAILKSPLFGLDDEDLIRFAPGRHGTLEEALQQARPDIAETLAAWRREALSETPATFYTRILARDGRRKAFLARLGSEANDALDEFIAMALAYEQQDWGSLAGFLHFMRAAETQVKRDMDHARDEVRVMTVHGAKGLEARIVFLADTMSAPDGKLAPKFYALRLPNSGADSRRQLVWAPSQKADVEVTALARAEALRLREEEYRRLLYVALTRAEDKLIICGASSSESTKDHWMALVEADVGIPFATVPADDGEGDIRRYAPRPVRMTKAADQVLAEAVPLPGWSLQKAPRLAPQQRPLVPSQALESDVLGYQEAARIAREQALLRGTLTHRLLQSLPDLVPDQREAAMRRFLTRQSGLSPDMATSVMADVARLMADPVFQPFFAPGSLAEVSVAGLVRGRPVSGQIDRLAMAGDTILIADYKTNDPAPQRLEEVPEVYLGQMAVYAALVQEAHPQSKVAAYLVWTAEARLMPLPSDVLDAALLRVMSQK